MQNPTTIETVVPKSTYIVPFYKVTEEGLIDAGKVPFKFAKGDKTDPNAFRQDGFITETVIATVRQYLVENNVGELQNPYTDEMIKHCNGILALIELRNAERRARQVQGTYQK